MLPPPRWSTLSLRSKGLFVVALPVLPLAIFWSLTAVALARREAPPNTAGPNMAVQSALARVFSVLLDADAGARDYLLTDNADALTRYEQAVARLPREMAALDEGLSGAHMRALHNELRTAVDDELAILDRIARGHSPPTPWIPERVALDRSAANLSHIRGLTTVMQERLVGVAAIRAFQTEVAGSVLVWILLIGSLVCTGAGFAAAIVVAGGLSRRISILARNADRLARGEALHAPPLGEDEIGQLDRRFREASRLLRSREAELRARTAELEATNRELEAFSYSVSHDLRAPLRAIDGFTELLESEYQRTLDDAGRDALGRVRRAAQRMGTLIDELLNLSRLTRADLTREPIDLTETVASIIDDVSRHHPPRPIEVRIEPGLSVEADPHLVRIALHNLIDNAWKYTARSARPRIEIGASPNGTTKVFHVRDNGVGFDMQYAGKLFGAFQRLHTERDFEGSGIGLAIVQRIVNRHGGRIWAESAIDAGAAFHFTLEPAPPEGP
ncbi:MAG TPA: ATP-binding protein [Vicinamibacterales bacterium]|nr:ATP-binding protein [Vicinamibacterales bacterium]